MTDIEKQARMVAARLLQKAGVKQFAGSQAYADLIEMAKAALQNQPFCGSGSDQAD